MWTCLFGCLGPDGADFIGGLFAGLGGAGNEDNARATADEKAGHGGSSIRTVS